MPRPIGSKIGPVKRVPPSQRIVRATVREGECWASNLMLAPNGYSRVGLGRPGVTRRDRNRSMPSHAYMYELLVGPIPEGTEMDHLCRNRRCWNPAHLEPVTHHENITRGIARRLQEVST